VSEDTRRVAFTRFVTDVQPKLRRALTARYGAERGREATADVLAWAWEHWDKVQELDNPAGYLYRIGYRKALRWKPAVPLVTEQPVYDDPQVEPELAHAFTRLTERQRTTVLLIHGYGWTHREVAEMLGITIPSVQKHAERGIAKLQRALGVAADV
jgi:DNA-directed RNA polymerase specialized sigma24 family protein